MVSCSRLPIVLCRGVLLTDGTESVARLFSGEELIANPREIPASKDASCNNQLKEEINSASWLCVD